MNSILKSICSFGCNINVTNSWARRLFRIIGSGLGLKGDASAKESNVP